MQSSVNQIVTSGLFSALKPLARWLLRCGVGYKEFSELGKKAFVDVATSDYGLRGRPTNISRVAVLTGLTRKEVRRIRDILDQGGDDMPLRRSPANQVLTGWHSDPDFCNSIGVPRSLNLEGDIDTFNMLVKRYGGDIPPVALLRELERGGGVKISDGKVFPLTRFFEPASMDEEYLSSAFFSVSNLISTIVHNSKVDRDTEGFVERYVFSTKLDDESAEKLRTLVEDSTGRFLISLDDWIVAQESGEDTPQKEVGQASTVGCGVYFFKNP